MPEGDTVWLAAKRMNAALGGRTLTRWDLRVPTFATTNYVGAQVVQVVPRGKHMLTRLDCDITLHTHFRMDGTWHLYQDGARWHGGPSWQIRLILGNNEWTAVGYRMPVVNVLPTSEEQKFVGHLGPDLLGENWDLSQALANLLRDPERGIADALIDQRNLAGLGTLYRAEALFLRGINPTTPVAQVSDLTALVQTAQRILSANKEHPEQSTTGRTGRGQQHYVFERFRKPCLRCGTMIKRGTSGQAPQERLTYWCPTCQPEL